MQTRVFVSVFLLLARIQFALAQSTPSPSPAVGVPGVDTFVNAVDKADRASDRWLFFATLGVFVIFGALVIRWLVKDRENSRKEHAEQLSAAYKEAALARQEHAATMKEMYGNQTKLAAELLVVMKENNENLTKSNSLMEENRRLLEKLSARP